jgi:UDP-galactopyranose mutase
MSKFDFLVVGSGFFGASFARTVKDAGKSCIVIEKKDHIGGAAHDKKVNDYFVSSYGAHIFHTHNKEIWNFIRKFGDFIPFTNRPKVVYEDRIFSFPINLMTLHQLWGVKTPEEAKNKLKEVTAPYKINHPKNFEEWALSMVGEEIYRIFFYGYTKKQWMREPRELPTSIIQRLPIRLTYDENYFTTPYQGMPENGYTKIIENMLDGIVVETNIDFLKNKEKWFNIAKMVVYTGPVDALFNYECGELEYNTLIFKQEEKYGDIQGNAVINYASENVPYIRSIEYKHFYKRGESIKHYNNQNHKEDSKELSIITYDYPVAYKDNPDPFYPIRNDKNSKTYEKYENLKNNYPNLIFGGRLGEYKYLDIDQSIGSAINKAKKAIKNV